MIKRERKEILDYLAKLTTPEKAMTVVGSDTQTLKDINQVMEKIRAHDALLRQWIADSDRKVLLSNLIEIAQQDSLDEPYEHLKTHYREDWDFNVVDLIYQTCLPDFDKLESVRDKLSKHKSSQIIAGELTRWINDE